MNTEPIMMSTEPTTSTEATVVDRATTLRDRLDRMRQINEARKNVVACTAPEHWRFGNAHFGWCRTCGNNFELGERLMWHARTLLAFHPACVARIHPHLAEWIATTRSRWVC